MLSTEGEWPFHPLSAGNTNSQTTPLMPIKKTWRGTETLREQKGGENREQSCRGRQCNGNERKRWRAMRTTINQRGKERAVREGWQWEAQQWSQAVEFDPTNINNSAQSVCDQLQNKYPHMCRLEEAERRVPCFFSHWLKKTDIN